ncbi:hypothetical protein [Streptococcus porci]|uniref:hypothetical protein n=1 Tax=Streptococcus porci TaxID=502567 RepID=UPI0004140F9D|nr:hypothetical protein [Streptococcus porci]
MKREIKQDQDNFMMTLTYQVSASQIDVWRLLATDEGFSRLVSRTSFGTEALSL